MEARRRNGPSWLAPALEVLRRRYFAGPAPWPGWTARDWSRATGAALAERLGLALGEALASAGVKLPKECWAALTVARLENERRRQGQAATLRDLAPRLAARGIAAVLFKGAALERHYPVPEVRESVDVDLLVEPDSLDGAAAVLREMGCRECSGGGRPASRYARTYVREVDGLEVAVDLHPTWHEVRVGANGARIWVGDASWPAERAEIADAVWAVPPLPVEIYLTAAHTVLHGFRTLSVYLDLALLLTADGTQGLGEAAVLARDNGRERHLRHACTLAGELFGLGLLDDYLSLPRRLGLPLPLRMGYLGRGLRLLPSSLLMELVLLRGVRRRLGFARWVLGHSERGPASGSRSQALRRLRRGLRSVRWLGPTLLRYRVPGHGAVAAFGAGRI